MATNPKKSRTLTEVNEQLTLTQTQIAAFQTAGRGGCDSRGGYGSRRVRGSCGVHGHVRTVRLYNNRNYCHTHGYDSYDTGTTCDSTTGGHRHDATFDDNMNGSQKNCALVV